MANKELKLLKKSESRNSRIKKIMNSKIQESYRNKYQKHIASSYGCKIVCVGNMSSKPFKTYFGKDAVYNFINSMIEESKYCREVLKKHFGKEPVMTKEDNEDFKNSTKCWICNNDYVENNIKVRDHCHITGKNRGSAHRDCNIIFNQITKFMSFFLQPKTNMIPILSCKN